MSLSKVIKSSSSYKTIKHRHLNLQSVNNHFEAKEQPIDNKLKELETEISLREEMIKTIEAKEQALQNNLQALEAHIHEKEETLVKLDQQINDQVEATLKKAASEGFDQGYQDGLAKAEHEYQERLANANSVTKSIENEKLERVEASKKAMIDLSFAIAEKILKSKLAESDEVWLPILEAAIKEWRETTEMKLYISPENFELVNKKRNDLEQLTQTSIAIYMDEQLDGYQCKVDSKFGMIDASLDSQLEVLKEILLKAVEGEEA